MSFNSNNKRVRDKAGNGSQRSGDSAITPWQDHTEFLKCCEELQSGVPLLNATKVRKLLMTTVVVNCCCQLLMKLRL